MDMQRWQMSLATLSHGETQAEELALHRFFLQRDNWIPAAAIDLRFNSFPIASLMY